MARGAGFWFDANTFELIPITDHAIWLGELEAKVRFDLDLTSEDKKHAKSLGLGEGKGWGVVSRETPGARRERLITSALKAGWVRIRRQERVLVMEFWRRSEDMLVSLAVALKQMEIPASENVELHEVEKDSPSVVLAGDLYKLTAKETEMTREEEARIGWSIYDNPKGKAGVVRMKGGSFRYRVTGNPMHFRGRKRVKNLVANPQQAETWGQVTYARLFVGLKTSRPFSRQTAGKVNSELPIDRVRLKVEIGNLHIRGDFTAGYSLVPQEGRFVPEQFRGKDVKASDLTVEQMKSFREKSVQVILFPEGDEVGENIDKWFHRINVLGNYLLLELDQYMVIWEVVLNGKFIGTGAWTFNEPPVGLPGLVNFRELAEKAQAIPKKGG